MSLDEKIEAAVAKLMAGEDPHEVLTSFAESVRGQTVERITEVHTCTSCGEDEVLCFSCKIRDTVGEQVMLAAPMVVPKVMAMVQEAVKNGIEARRRKRAREQSRERTEEGEAWKSRPHPGPQKF